GSVPFAVGAWPEVAAREPDDTPADAQPLTPPCTILGAMEKTGDVDNFRIEARAGQELVFEVIAQPIRSRLQPVLTLLDAAGKTRAESTPRSGRRDAVLGYHFPTAGGYVLQLRDAVNASGGDPYYRLNVGEFPTIIRFFPLGLQKGTTAAIEMEGF